MSAEDESAHDQHGIGSLGEEAVRLLGSLAGWAGQHGAEVHQGVEDVARQACEGVQSLADGMEEHLATGAAECTWCPLCRTVHTVRELSPEVKTHLVTAASSLVKAASALLATVVPEHHGSGDHKSGTDGSRPGESGPGGAASSPTDAPRPGTRRGSRGRSSGVQHIDIDEPDPTT